MSAVPIIVGYALREALRRKVFVVVLVLTAAFLSLYAFGTTQIFQEIAEVEGQAGELPVDEQVAAGATLLGLSMFGTLFLATVLAIFLTLGVVRGDAERGLLQPLVVRPVGRATLLVARYLAAVAVALPYVLAVYFGAVAVRRTRHAVPAALIADLVAAIAAVAVCAWMF
jgi:ABC-type transport system involved in multi-copper enzyme maturation permease subunit